MLNPNPFEALRRGGVFTVLDQFAVIEASGADAATFLHNQLTNDVKQLDTNKAQLAGLCSVKGRLLASFFLWRTAETIQLLVPAELQAAVQKRLSMFILRSKVKLEEASPKLTLIGLMGAVENTLTPFFPTLPRAIYEKVESDAGILIRLTDLPHALTDTTSTVSERTRYLWLAPQQAGLVHPEKLATDLIQVPSAIWDWCEIQAGIPWITEATQEQFVPQMVNFELIGGINFRKGCYPGQEVIARLHYRGVVRRRTILAHTVAAQPGLEVFHSEEQSQACGIVVNAAPAPNGGVDCLVHLQLNALNQGTLHMGAANGPQLELLPLPYALPKME